MSTSESKKLNLSFPEYYERFGDSEFRNEDTIYTTYDVEKFTTEKPFVEQLNKYITYFNWIDFGVSSKAVDAGWDDLYYQTIVEFGIYWLNQFNENLDLDKLKAFLDAYGETANDLGDEEYTKEGDMVEKHLKAFIKKYGVNKFIKMIEEKDIKTFCKFVADSFDEVCYKAFDDDD